MLVIRLLSEAFSVRAKFLMGVSRKFVIRPINSVTLQNTINIFDILHVQDPIVLMIVIRLISEAFQGGAKFFKGVPRKFVIPPMNSVIVQNTISIFDSLHV